MKSFKKVVSLVLTFCMVLCFLPILPASAETTKAFSYAEKLNAEVGKDIINHDYSTMSELPSEAKNMAYTKLAGSDATNNENALYLYFSGNWVYASNVEFDVNSANYAARVTFAITKSTSIKNSGAFCFSTIGTDAEGNDLSASFVSFGMPQRTANAPTAGSAKVYNQNAQYGFNTIGNVTPFLSDADEGSVITYTFEVYCFNGINYYVKEDGTLIGSSTHNTESTVGKNNKISFSCDSCNIYVTDFTVKELKEKTPLVTKDEFAQKTGFTAGSVIAEYDFSKITAGTTPENWVFSSSNINKGSSDTSGVNVLRLANDSGGSSATLTLPVKTGFVAVAEIGIDYDQKLSGMFGFGINDGTNEAFSFSLALPKRSSSNYPHAGSVRIMDYSKTGDYKYQYPTTYEYSTEAAGYTQKTMFAYVYDGKFYCCFEDGNIFYSSDVNPSYSPSDNMYLTFFNDWATAYVHSLAVYEVSPYVAPAEKELVSTSGFIAGEVMHNYDFSAMEAGSVPEGATFGDGISIAKGSSASAGENVLKLSNTVGYTGAGVLPVTNTDFAAVITVGIDYAQTLAGTLWIRFLDSNGNTCAGYGLGLPKRSESQTLKAGASVINNGAAADKYQYPAAGKYTFNTDGYTKLKLVVYSYDNNFYFYWADGTYIGTCTSAQGTDMTSGSGSIAFSTDWATAYVHSVKVYNIAANTFGVKSAAVKLNSDNDPYVNFDFAFENTLPDTVSEENLTFGAVVTFKDTAVTENTDYETEGAVIWTLEAAEVSGNTSKFTKTMNITEDNIDKYVNIRPFIKYGEEISYNDADSFCPAKLADVYYRSLQDSTEKTAFAEKFASSELFKGSDSKKVTFTVFSDFHYKQGMYLSNIADMNAIFDRANESGSSFVLSAGDMCNDFTGSPELVKAFKNNKYGLTAANIYGNHELESNGNSMEVVTQTLTNATNVVWGTSDGTYSSDIGYYYFENEGFRIICLDTNYSWNTTTESWEHNRTASWGQPSGNINGTALGEAQLTWLEKVLNDAGKNGIPCIVMSHAILRPDWRGGYDSAQAQQLFNEVNEKYPGTVLMQIAGHAHIDRIEETDGIVWWIVNTTRNNYWVSQQNEHYTDGQTYMMETYDAEGNFTGYEEKEISSIGAQTWFSADPLSAVVTVDSCGIITIDGYESSYIFDVDPGLKGEPYTHAYIGNYSTFGCEDQHVWDYTYAENGDVTYGECLHPECSLAIVNGNKALQVKSNAQDNETYKVSVKYSTDKAANIGFYTADSDNANTVGYAESKDKAIYTLSPDKNYAEIYVTVDKVGGKDNALGSTLYMYVINGDVDDINVTDIKAEKLTNVSGKSLISNKGVSILSDVSADKDQAMRFYFSYDSVSGNDIVIDGKTYTVKSRGFLLTNGNNNSEKQVTRSTADGKTIIDYNVNGENLTKSWKTVANSDTLNSSELWYSMYITGFESENSTYNNSMKIYVKGYVVVEIDGSEFTLYSEEINTTVAGVANLLP